MSGSLKGLGSRAVIGAFNRRMEEVTRASWTTLLATDYDSNQETETYTFTSDVPGLVEEQGDNVTAAELKRFEFSIRNKKFRGGLRFDEDDWRRDKTGQILLKSRAMGSKAAILPQKILTELLIANGNAYDGVAFYHATGHVNLNGDQVVNAIQVAAASGTNPTAAEMEGAILTAIETMLGHKDDDGQPANEGALNFAVMVPIAYWKQAKAAVKNEYNTSGVQGMLKATDFTVTIIANARLAAPYIHVFRTDGDVKALVWQDEVKPQMNELGAGSEYNIMYDKRLFLAKRVCNGGYGRYDQSVRVEFT